MKYSRRQRSVRKTRRAATRQQRQQRQQRQHGRGSNISTNFVFENPLMRRVTPSLMPTTAIRVPVNEPAPLYARHGKTNINTRRRSLKNNAAHQQYVGINVNAASASNVNVVRNYKSPVRRSVAETESAPSPIRHFKEFATDLVPHKLAPSKSWLLHHTSKMPGSRHLQI